MKKITPVLLGLLGLLGLLSLSGSALAEEKICTHENARNNGFVYCDNEWWHTIDCPDCGIVKHVAEGEYAGIDTDGHSVHCPECGMNWSENHIYACDGSDEFGTCVFCKAENVNVVEHNPDGSMTYVYQDEDWHHSYCGICGSDQGERAHFMNCDGSDRCAVCGAEGVNYAYSDHVTQLVGFDKECCYYACSCGEWTYEVWHGIYCDSKDKNTCAECGKNTEIDGIVMTDIWHDTECGFDEKNCWTVCKACGYFPYFDEHYTGCMDDDDTRCDNCGRSEDDGIILTWKHTSLDHDDWNEDDILKHRQVCWECGYEGEDHEAQDLVYIPIDGDKSYHSVSCSGCEFEWKETHEAECGSGSDECTYCGAEDVYIGMHSNHPDDSVTYICSNEDGHKVYCGICGDDWGWEEHAADCSDPDRCKYCGAEGVNFIEVDHVVQIVGFDDECCYYACSCGEEAYDWKHVVYCDSEDQNTCVGCGKNVDADGIRIGLIWHYDYVGYDENECWNTCTNCGDLYRGEHYFSCLDGEMMYCGYCGASSDEVNIQVFRHSDIDFNDNGEGWHDPWCTYCGEHLGEPHEYHLSFAYGGYETCHVYCDTCGYLTDWEHQGQCGQPDEHTVCIRCDAEDVKVYGHGNHIGSDEFACIDEDWHRAFCSVCGDEHYSEEHRSAVGSDADFGTCAVCGAENVNLYGPVKYEERIEDGMLLLISYNEDGSKHIDYFGAESGDYYGWEWYEHWDDEEPRDWEHFSDIVYETEELALSGRVDMHRSVRTCDGSHGIMYYRIDKDDDMFLCYEDRYLGDGISRIETVWNQEENVYYETKWENDFLVYIECLTSDWRTITHTTWAYYAGIGPVVTELGRLDDGETAYEKIYTNPDDDTTYAERIYIDEDSYNWHSFTVGGVTRSADGSVLKLPKGIQRIESEAFAGIPGLTVVLPQNVTFIASDAFSSDTVMLVPNEEIALLAQEAGYVWFFE